MASVEGHNCNPVGCSTCGVDRLMEAAERVYHWVGPGWPDLDDQEERDLFMKDVSTLAATWYGIKYRGWMSRA
jgi:hypothetical protein